MHAAVVVVISAAAFFSLFGFSLSLRRDVSHCESFDLPILKEISSRITYYMYYEDILDTLAALDRSSINFQTKKPDLINIYMYYTGATSIDEVYMCE